MKGEVQVPSNSSKRCPHARCHTLSFQIHPSAPQVAKSLLCLSLCSSDVADPGCLDKRLDKSASNKHTTLTSLVFFLNWIKNKTQFLFFSSQCMLRISAPNDYTPTPTVQENWDASGQCLEAQRLPLAQHPSPCSHPFPGLTSRTYTHEQEEERLGVQGTEERHQASLLQNIYFLRSALVFMGV